MVQLVVLFSLALGPVFQSTVSLTSAIVVKMITIFNSQGFLLKKCEMQKLLTFIFSAKMLALMPYSTVKVLTMFVRLSLLTMTNPNQLCDVLLCVCSKMADETNLISKLPVAARTRGV